MKLLNEKVLSKYKTKDKKIKCSECKKKSNSVVSYISDDIFKRLSCDGVFLCINCIKKGYLLLAKDERITLRIEEDK